MQKFFLSVHIGSPPAAIHLLVLLHLLEDVFKDTLLRYRESKRRAHHQEGLKLMTFLIARRVLNQTTVLRMLPLFGR